MKKILMIIFIFILCNSLKAIEKTYGDLVVSKLVSVYDGDTFTVNLFNTPDIIGEKISVRMSGVDTQEIKDKDATKRAKAQLAKKFTLDKLIKAKVITLKNIKRDKYFRLDAEVYVDTENLGESLIKQGLGYAYYGGTKE